MRIFLLLTAIAALTFPFLPAGSAINAQTESSARLDAPTITATAEGGAIELSWNQVSGAVRYELWTWTDDAGWQQLDEGNLTATTHRHDGVTPGTTYYYAIRAVAASGLTSEWSEYANATVSPTQGSATTPTASPTVTPTPTQTTEPATLDKAAQRAALVALYNATDGPNWSRRDNWLTDQPLSTWYGVSTDANGNVTWLFLGSNNLSGSIPDLSALTSLRKLDLLVNDLSGSIPDLSALTNLSELRLENNQFSGPIPDPSALTNLTYLHLGSNRLTGSIPDLSALTKLSYLDLGGNQLSGSIPDLSALTSLVSLFLHNNELSGAIPSLSALTRLEQMNLGNNKLSGQIPSLRTLTELRELSIWGTRISGPIPDLSALTELINLYLYDNELSGSVPDLSALTNLRNLYLNGNQLTGPIPDLRPFTKLEGASFEGNQLCLPAGASLSHPNAAVDAALQVLNLSTCPGTAQPTPTPTQTPLSLGHCNAYANVFRHPASPNPLRNLLRHERGRTQLDGCNRRNSLRALGLGQCK